MTMRSPSQSPTVLDYELADGRPPVLRTPDLPDLDAAAGWLTEIRDDLRRDLHQHAHILLRGLPVGSAADFARVRDLLLGARTAYREQATPRSDFGDDVFSSTDFPAAQTIRLHNENSYTLDFPGILIFCSIDAATTGGATTVGDVRQVLADLPPDLVARFREHGWLLNRNYRNGIGLPWTTAFATEERADVEAYCERNLVGSRWLPDNELATTQRRSAIIRHPVTAEEVWFNHVVFWSRWSLAPEVRTALLEMYGDDGLPFDTRLGDGTLLTEGESTAIDQAYQRATRRESWQPGDVMIVDNLLSAHGRESFTGTRKTLVAMGEPIRLEDCSPTVPPAAGPAS
ncbi:TauD/TfdA family dioxygenase [Jidongwangia harbinensis]|uniref:TauD/TfdA family dioxygenase n=1 Tax=Jidongwangia harbinensis TaxID=2878561 RepID=UPI001CDA0FC7|nr:TauD/TfdA family dioxygenase [Jidongwangia harbinensis]MCA2218767.1 TauD/TfdA family dioxygenase [Jidongwangia harbinensis]